MGRAVVGAVGMGGPARARAGRVRGALVVEKEASGAATAAVAVAGEMDRAAVVVATSPALAGQASASSPS